MSGPATVLIVPGLRDDAPGHWQSVLAAGDARIRSVPVQGKAMLDCAARVRALEDAAQAIEGPLLLVAHSGGCLTVAHWAARTRRTVYAALLAVPPDFETPMPAPYPGRDALQAAGWFPLPRQRLPFPSLVAASRDDPLASFEAAQALATDWGSRLVDLGAVGHLNPASGYGPWPQARELIDHLQRLN